MHKKLLFTLLAIVVADNANADARFISAPQSAPEINRLQYVQNAIDSLGESDLRRLVFYTDRTIGSLTQIVEASNQGKFNELDKLIENLRSNISRLSDAGQRSGVPDEDVTRFFIQTVNDNYGADFLEQVSLAAGGLDIPTLFRNVTTISVPDSSTLNDNSQFLSALENASAGLTLSEASGQTQIIETEQQQPRPVARPNATPAERAVIERIEIVPNGWEITVVAGDSLALIASALYGDSLSFNIIFQANLNILTNPNSLNIGDRLKLPMP